MLSCLLGRSLHNNNYSSSNNNKCVVEMFIAYKVVNIHFIRKWVLKNIFFAFGTFLKFTVNYCKGSFQFKLGEILCNLPLEVLYNDNKEKSSVYIDIRFNKTTLNVVGKISILYLVIPKSVYQLRDFRTG